MSNASESYNKDRLFRHVIIENQYISNIVIEQLRWINLATTGSLITMIQSGRIDMFKEFFNIIKDRLPVSRGFMINLCYQGDADALLYFLTETPNKLYPTDNFFRFNVSKKNTPIWDETTIEMMILYHKLRPTDRAFIINILIDWILMAKQTRDDNEQQSLLKDYIHRANQILPSITKDEINQLQRYLIDPLSQEFWSKQLTYIHKPYSYEESPRRMPYIPRKALSSYQPTLFLFETSIEKGDLDTVKQMREKIKTCSHAAVHNAGACGSLDMIKYLLEQYPTTRSQMFLIWYQAIRYAHVHVLEYMVENNLIRFNRNLAEKSIKESFYFKTKTLDFGVLRFILDNYKPTPLKKGFKKISPYFVNFINGFQIPAVQIRYNEILEIFHSYFKKDPYFRIAKLTSGLYHLARIASAFGYVHTMSGLDRDFNFKLGIYTFLL